MSSTNRGKERSPRDFYPTPDFAFKNLLPHLPRGPKYWEPSCGDGRLINWMREAGLDADGSDLALGTNYLEDNTMHDFVITNPPFSIGLEFCQHAVAHANEVLFLLPVTFLGSIKRRDWFVEHEPSALFVITPRPSFGLNKNGKKGTDSNEYAWFYWGARWSGIKHLLPVKSV